ncbi:hypothetical protein PG913_08515 [Tenacibaculum pacificus]|uniref:hypothetical protein n=1 Tax=Tenacibaculum pacificus TaxID=3018314 RepID=UPI0022F3A254|nr:hypothetical protein [Tenacibaculum pacificus]WBX72943.1 hypothetical protein PG913_08515 [Tenacibaculum pacificus]
MPLILKKTAYLDNNILIDIEQGLISIDDLRNNIDENITEFYYSSAHLQEANEMTAKTDVELKNRLEKRFATISLVTNNNYITQELPSNKVFSQIENPKTVYNTIKDVTSTQSAIKAMLNTISEEQKNDFRERMEIDSKLMNNYSPKEVIEQVNTRSEALGGLSLVGMIENGVNLHPQGKEMGMGNRFAGVFELLDLIGYWKDKYNSKSNYARLWDASHSFYSSYFDYFVSDDKRTRNKAKVAFEIYGAKTQVVSSKDTKKK